MLDGPYTVTALCMCAQIIPCRNRSVVMDFYRACSYFSYIIQFHMLTTERDVVSCSITNCLSPLPNVILSICECIFHHEHFHFGLK